MSCVPPLSRFPLPESRTIQVFEDNYSLKASILSVPGGSLAALMGNRQK